MPGGLGVKTWWTRIGRYCRQDVWNVDLNRTRGLHRLSVKTLRLLLVIVWEFQNSALGVRATSLVYTTLLSLVPFLAVMFSVLKAFGVYQQIEPVLAQALEPLGEKGAEITQKVIGFVQNLKVGVLGALGVAGLFYTTYSLIDKIEESLNAIWHVSKGRPFARKFTDYLSVVLVGPVLVFTAFGLTASAQSYWLVQWLLEIQPLGAAVVLATKLLPYLFMIALFTFIYAFVPYTKVDLKAALVGGVTAGVLWQLAGMAFAAFVVSSGRYSAIYSSFAVLILFLIWLYVGWVIVLVGAQVAYYVQYPEAYLKHAHWREKSPAFRERLALSLLVLITRRYLNGQPPLAEQDIARRLGVPPSVVEDLVEAFIRYGIVVRTAEPEGVTLARPPEHVLISDVLAFLAYGQVSDRSSDAMAFEEPVIAVLERRDQAVQTALAHLTLRSLAMNGAGMELTGSPGDLARELAPM
ncbi:MAG: YihY family inner membrane protein [Nitrospirae bacterium]|nr:MAG: YihY family inner membrane protein [Nitrospirota bacterium]